MVMSQTTHDDVTSTPHPTADPVHVRVIKHKTLEDVESARAEDAEDVAIARERLADKSHGTIRLADLRQELGV